VERGILNANWKNTASGGFFPNRGGERWRVSKVVHLHWG
jgi:hypothetical protein